MGHLFFLLLALGAPTALVAQSYYDQTNPVQSFTPVPRSGPGIESPRRPTPTNVRALVVTDDNGREHPLVGRDDVKFGDLSGQSRSDGSSLPPGMERGVRDLEAGMEEVGAYTSEMAVHIQKHGLRGYLAVPPELKEKGRAIGRRVGSGIGGIMHDVGREMVAPAQPQ